MARTRILPIYTLWPWFKRYYLGSRSWHTLGILITIVWNIIKIQHGSKELWPRHRFCLSIHCNLILDIWPWFNVMTHPCVMDNNCVKYYKDQHGSQELWSGHRFWLSVHCDLYFGDMTLGQGHDTSLGHEEQLCEILSRSDKGVRSYIPDTMWTDGRGDSYIPTGTWGINRNQQQLVYV